MKVRLGMCSDGSVLSFDAQTYAFKLGPRSVPYEDVLELDDYGRIHWCAMEQRDWFRKVDRELLQQSARDASQQRLQANPNDLTPQQRVLADAAQSDEILAGAIVEADPALVQAVSDELEKRGLVGRGATADGNPLASMQLPQGMEALSQMERAQDPRRPMTRLERRLMKRILKNDDKQKSRRERLESPAYSETTGGEED